MLLCLVFLGALSTVKQLAADILFFIAIVTLAGELNPQLKSNLT